ncbi:MAG: SDR family oxidoreductase [Bacteroidota bacterium]
MKIAVTAANGQLGSSIVNELKQEIGSDHVVGIVRSPEKASYLGIELRKGDYNSRDEYDVALRGVDRVLLISGKDYPEKRIQQHRNVIEAAKQNGVQKIVYTSIIGDEEKTAFSPVVKSNRQTEENVRQSGLDWIIGRNGIYIEPDLEYIATYQREGEIRNSAGNGKCGYTSREELGYAYTQLLLNDRHYGQTYNLLGEPITQTRLAELINQVFSTSLSYNPVSVEAYEKERKDELGDFLGTVIAGIYDGIKQGANDVPSQFEQAAGRPHQSVIEMMQAFKKN